MIRPPGMEGVVFSESDEGDIRHDQAARSRLCAVGGIPTGWATVDQVHGNDVLRVDESGGAGSADALWTSEPGLAVAVFTADCFGVVLTSPRAVGVAHAGWRGAASEVVGRLRAEMADAGHAPKAAAVGPGIGPCCFEVGADVLQLFPGHESRTRWETDSVDLRSAVRDQLEGLGPWLSAACTYHHDGLFSHRRENTLERMAAVGWVT